MIDNYISIIIPVYNVEKYLPRCIDSILAQTYTNFELLLIDDGSPDNSGKVCDEYAAQDSRIKVFHKGNGGVSSARNCGIKNAAGEWITFIDSDDFIDEVYLEELLKGTHCDISYIGIAKYNLDKDVKESNITNFTTIELNKLTKYEEGIIQNDLLAIGFPYGKLLKKGIIDKYNICFDERLRNHEDHLFCFDYLVHCDSIYVSGVVAYNWTYKSNSTSLSHTLPRYQDLLIASDRFLCIYPTLFRKFGIVSSQYIARITREYGVYTRRASVYSLYRSNISKKERMGVLQEQTPIFNQIFREWHWVLNNMKYRIIYVIMSSRLLPAILKDLIFSTIYR